MIDHAADGVCGTCGRQIRAPKPVSDFVRPPDMSDEQSAAQEAFYARVERQRQDASNGRPPLLRGRSQPRNRAKDGITPECSTQAATPAPAREPHDRMRCAAGPKARRSKKAWIFTPRTEQIRRSLESRRVATRTVRPSLVSRRPERYCWPGHRDMAIAAATTRARTSTVNGFDK
jgi:hypothetical protein